MTRLRMFRDDEPEETRHVSPRTTIVGGRPPEARADLPPVPTGIQKLLRLASVDPSFREELLRRRSGLATVAGVTLTASEQAILGAIPAEQLDGMIGALPPPPESRRTFLRQTASTAVMLLGGAVLAECVGCKGHRSDVPPERRDADADEADVSDAAASPTDSAAPPLDAGRAPPPPQPPGPSTWEGPPLRPEDMPPPAGGARPDWPGPSDEDPIPERPVHDPTVTEGGISPHLDEPPRPREQLVAPGGAMADEPPERPDDRGMATTGGAAPDWPSQKK